MALKMFSDIYKEIFPFWDEISYSDKSIICESTRALSYPRGTCIHNGDGCSGVIIVRKGCLRVYIMSEDGKDVTLYRLHGGDICMLSASCVLQSVTFDIFVDAEEDSECYVIEDSAYSAVSERNPNIKIFTLQTALGRFSDVMWVMQQILFFGVDRRLAIFLCEETARTNSLLIPYTHEQIAKYIGSAREVVSRMLKYFSNEGMVEVSRGGVKVLLPERLKTIAGN